MLCTKCGKTWVPGEATVCSSCAPGGPSAGGAGAPAGASSNVGISGRMVPTGNKPALIGYYLVFVALLPYVPWAQFGIEIGLSAEVRAALSGVLAVAAVVFGVIGAKLAYVKPEVRGGKHAWLAIVFGGLIAAAWICALAGIIRF